MPPIVSDPKVLGGKPVIAGTRVSVELILEELSNGRSPAELLEWYPHLTQDGIQAALRYALGVLRNDDVAPIQVHG